MPRGERKADGRGKVAAATWPWGAVFVDRSGTRLA
jgi:hypothetical protein